MKKLRMTRQRAIILKELQNCHSHPTAYEVHAMVRQQLPHISLGTVYRNLELLSDHGVISRIDSAGEQRHFDGNTEKHNHIRCLICGRIDDTTKQITLPVESTGDCLFRGYKINGYTVEFFGVCPACQAARNAFILDKEQKS